MSLGQRALGGFFWTTLESFGGKGISFVTTLVLARLLTPEDFGLVAMITIFFAISNNLVDSGFSQALIREKDISEEDRATTFYVNFIISCVIYATLWFGAPVIAQFFEQPELLKLTRFMGLTVIFYSLTIVQRAVLTQSLNFKHQAYINIIASGLTGIIALILAFTDFGVWALAIRSVMMALFTSLFYWIINRWWPKGFITKASFKKLFGFGSKLMASGLLDKMFQHVYKLIIGKFFTAATLGFYTQASSFKSMASKNVVSSLQKVTYPILSKTKENPDKLKSGYRKIIKITSFFIFPAMIGLAFVAKPLILTLIGERWLPAVPMLQILCFSGILYHLHAINLNILKVVGRSDLFLKLEVIKKVNTTIVIIIGLQFGIWGLLIGQVVSSYIALFVNIYYTTTFINYTIKEQLGDILPILLLMIPVIIILTVLNLFPLDIVALQLIVMVLGGILLYGLTNLLFRPQPMNMVVELLQQRIKFLQRIDL